jgi:PAS domain S-box-containing protein
MKDFVTSGMHDDYDVEITRKVIMINVIAVIGVINLIPLGILAFTQGNYPLGYFDFVVAAVLVVTLLYLRTSRRYDHASYLGIAFVAALFVYLFITGGQNNTGHVWYYTFPLFSAFLLGSRRGAMASVILLLPVIWLFATYNTSPSFAVYPTDFKIRFIPSFLVVLGYSYVFENIRERTQHKLSIRNMELQEGVAELENAEDALTKARDQLERRVIERTAELTRANEQLNSEVEERKQVEVALRKSREEYKTLVDSSLTGIFIHQDRKYVFLNNRFAEIHAYKPEELLGQDPLSLIHPDEREDLREIASRRLRGEAVPQRYEVRRLRKDGETVWCEMMANVIDYKGRPAIMGNMVDITARKRADDALRHSEERYRSLVENVDLGVTLIDLDHNIVMTNTAYGRMYNKPVNEFFGKKCFREFRKQEAVCSDCPGVKAMDTGRPATTETEGVRDDGTQFSARVHAFPTFGPDDTVTGFIEVVEDITERKRLEAQFQQAQKMESIGTLAGGIAHDFNNVLMGIQGRASLMMLRIDSEHPHLEHLKGIETAVEDGARLTRQLLGFARGGKYEVKPTDLNELIKKGCEMFGRTRREIEIHTKHQQGMWMVEVDQGQIEQVLLNLCVNAWQAMPDGGSLYVETSNVVLDEDYTRPFHAEPGDYVKLSVTDTGVGMDKETQQKIFDPFFTTKDMGRGTGLGLASAYGIIKNHGGIINVYSEKGKGTTFNICLPASKKQVTTSKERVVEEILRGAETVLLVDDEDLVLEVGEKILKEMGYKVLLARDGREGVDVYSKHREKVDMVILDMIMPGMGGGEAYDRLKESNPQVKVLLSSGYSINGQASEILERGCNGFIQKPFKVKELSAKIRQILDKE